MILIADSGSTKTDWGIVSELGQKDIVFQTEGINPLFRKEDEIVQLLEDKVVSRLDEVPHSIFFYGAGCVGDKQIERLENAFSKVWEDSHITIQSDLYAAAHALCPNKEGIVVILGTGMNSCLWRGEEKQQQVRTLGYVLGDEGSGAFLGKMLLKYVFRQECSPELADAFFSHYDTTYAEVIERVYNKPLPNRYLASFCRFIYQNIDNDEMKNLVENAFSVFFEDILEKYPKGMPVYCCGSIAYYFKKILCQVASQYEREVKGVIQSPMEGLLEFYKKLN